jgi:hypothetical protein
MISFGLVFGILALTLTSLVSADVESLFVVIVAFLVGQCGLVTYSKVSRARYCAQEVQKLANILKVSDLVRQQYVAVTQKSTAQFSFQQAYGSVA